MTALNNMKSSNDLPDITTFPSFQSFAPDGKTIRDPDPSACVVSEFVFSKTRWANFPDKSGRHFIGQSPIKGEESQSATLPDWTLSDILSENIENWSCHFCGKKGDSCIGAECVQAFRQNSQNALESLEIQHTDEPQYGVYCKGNTLIPAGSILGEYIGEVSVRKGPCTLDIF